MNKDKWKPFLWHCFNCGNIVVGYRNKKGDIKAECEKCRTCMVRVIKEKNHDTVDVFAPPGSSQL